MSAFELQAGAGSSMLLGTAFVIHVSLSRATTAPDLLLVTSRAHVRAPGHDTGLSRQP